GDPGRGGCEGGPAMGPDLPGPDRSAAGGWAGGGRDGGAGAVHDAGGQAAAAGSLGHGVLGWAGGGGWGADRGAEVEGQRIRRGPAGGDGRGGDDPDLRVHGAPDAALVEDAGGGDVSGGRRGEVRM